jgi:hypothetical protein
MLHSPLRDRVIELIKANPDLTIRSIAKTLSDGLGYEVTYDAVAGHVKRAKKRGVLVGRRTRRPETSKKFVRIAKITVRQRSLPVIPLPIQPDYHWDDTQREISGCRFTYGDVEKDWGYCQATQKSGSSYCEQHHAVCHIGLKARDVL